MIKIILILICCLLAGCTDETKAISVLEAEGYKDIQITGYNIWACSEDDFYHTGFTATSAVGKQVSGTVCSGLMFKGATVRFN